MKEGEGKLIDILLLAEVISNFFSYLASDQVVTQLVNQTILVQDSSDID